MWLPECSTSSTRSHLDKAMLGNVLSNPSSTERERNREYEREKERLSSLRSRKRDTDGRREAPPRTHMARRRCHPSRGRAARHRCRPQGRRRWRTGPRAWAIRPGRLAASRPAPPRPEERRLTERRPNQERRPKGDDSTLPRVHF